MIENFIDIVRKSLYGESDNKVVKLNKRMAYKSSTIKFGVESESCFLKPSEKKNISEKYMPRIVSESDDVFSDIGKFEEERRTKLKLRKFKKSHCKSPSESEFSDVPFIEKKEKQDKFKNTPNDIKDCIGFGDPLPFNFNDFYSSYRTIDIKLHDFHTGIENAFVKKKIGNVQISSKKLYAYDSCPAEDLQSEPNNAENQSLFDEENSPIIDFRTDNLINEPKESIDINPKKLRKKSICKCFDLGSQKLVMVKANSSVPLFGLCLLKVLHGNIEILGCVLSKKSKEVDIYSPRGSSLLVVHNRTTVNEEIDFSEIQPLLDNIEKLKDVEIENTTAIFICSKIESHKIKLVEKYTSQQIFPRIGNSRVPRVIFDPEDKFNVTSVNRQWDQVLELVNTSTRMLIAGGKGVGKSTFVRYSINKLLNRFKKIRIIDLDPGQSEFLVPGCISVVTVSDPILGPNYTHLQKTDRSYLSNIDIAHNPGEYLNQIKLLIDSLTVTEDIPTLINYMGFATGIGLHIISSAITYLKPTNVVQIQSTSNKKNFKTDLTVNTVKEHCSLFGSAPMNFKFDLIKISAMTDDNTGWSLESRQARELCIFAYFGQMMKSGLETLTSHLVPMYQVSLSSIKITNSVGTEIPPAAVNANMVTLCSKIEDTNIFNVFGFGIVRHVDLRNEELILITPEHLNDLEKVDYLVLTNVYLPPSVYMTTDDVVGHVSYVMEGDLEDLGQITKRSYIPPNKNK